MEKQDIESGDVYKELCEKFEQGKSKRNAEVLRSFLNDDRIIDFRGQHAEYLHLRSLRAEAFTLFGHYLKASREYQLAVPYASQARKWKFLLQQGSMLLWHLFTTPSAEASDVFLKCEKTLDKAMENIPAGKDKIFQQITVAGLNAFLKGLNQQTSEGVSLLKKMNFLPVPIPQYNDKNELVILFRYFFMGMAVAIEAKDRQLLLQMLKVISIDDQTLYGEKNLFRLLWETMNQAFDMRPEFAEGFNQLFNQRNHLSPAYPNLRYFLDNVGAGMHTALDLFFSEFK
ncbi:hypothetical protein [Prolixibacter denitrificans]|uniref:Uncharacterized protein n=1 Tax=Prolixibacter denitrificans TaxID=1541063 RepID=A0A2P8C9K0_9BACT|nr:hypothetical protein [Prolixibacter denitrificans]PSK81638.1 hypothetical protein CLV93_10836 [Prolixibacter denitrificans]GET21163.1 hypothetical protein JCM18694_14090 [Prolixibacter denitrificans]